MIRFVHIRTLFISYWHLPVLFWTILQAAPALAQLSPGDLSRPHAHLEGLRQCGRCHELGSREVTAKCLDCHREIAAARDTGRGLHAQDDFADCVDCHVEHQGRDYDLIFWPDGPEGVDHAALGFPLQGRHAELACRACHRDEMVVRRDALLAAGKDLDRTYLGLGTDCTDCHADVHLGQLPADCSSCHDTRAWRPAPGFDHAAVFPLRGRHAETACARCHAPRADDDPATLRFAAPRRALCADCHDDPHANALGRRCADCHTPAGWRDVTAGAFDHDRTAYPLRGRHAAVACRACHGGDRARPAHGACLDCHADHHGVSSRTRAGRPACEDCHTVAGFSPANYGLADHETTAFPLRGAHRAIPCDACHRPEADAPTQLALAHGTCSDCHADPHGRPPGRTAIACRTCHDAETWRRITFDHAGTGFVLTDRHAAIACRACHQGADLRDPPAFADPAPRDCAGCHDDVHRGQFRRPGESATDCDRCHVTRDWLAERFDHDRDSRFPLHGAHRSVACAGCHPPAPHEGDTRRFKPLDTACLACHAAATATTGSRP